MDIPAEIPVSYQPIWEDGYNQAIGEGIVEAVEHAWDELERYLFEGAVGKAAKEIRKAGGKTHVAFQGGMTDMDIMDIYGDPNAGMPDNMNNPAYKKDNPDEGETESQPWRPVAKYNGSNTDQIIDDINEHRRIIMQRYITPEMVLALYGIPISSKDYQMLYRWMETNMLKSKRRLHDKKHTV